jgi:hypothetical protein
MASDPHTEVTTGQSVEMPRSTAAPLVLGLGIALLAAGVVFGLAFVVVGALVLVAGLLLWITQLLPGQGHMHETLAGPAIPRPVTVVPGRVEHLRQGMPGYRMRLPQDVHPISAGIKGGIIGGIIMPVPALLWGLFSGYGPWYPVNLLAGIALPGVGGMSIDDLKKLQPSLLLVALVVHVVLSVVVGLIYGVLLPTLPQVPRSIAWGGLLMPIVWTAASYVAMTIANPALPAKVSWPWFIVSQFVFGITMPAVVLGLRGVPRILAGPAGGLVGGVAMALPAFAWAAASGHGLWYPVNLLAGMFRPEVGQLGPQELARFHAEWFLPATVLHAGLSMFFGLVFALAIPRLPPMPAPLAWGGLVLPLVWTGSNYGLMGVVNPVLQERVDWAWFVVSQFVFGVAAAVVVLRSETVHIPPAGRGSDRVADFVTGDGGSPT